MTTNATADTTPASAREEGWASITLEFIGGSDDKTAGNLLSHMETWCLRLRTATGDREIRLVEGRAENDEGVGGIGFEPVDDDGEPTGPIEFLDYAAIVALGIY